MKIMIGGGFDDSKGTDQAVVRFAAELSRQVIAQGHELRLGNLSSLDELIIETATVQAEALNLDPQKKVVSYIPQGAAPRTTLCNVKESLSEDWSSVRGKHPRVPEPIQQADVVILVGGYGDKSGAFTAAYWARQSGTPMLPISTFGMAARELYEDIHGSPESQKTTGLPSDDIDTLVTAEAALTDDIRINAYARQIVALAEKAGLSRDVFLIMSFSEGDPSLDDYNLAIEELCKSAGFDAVRTDTRPPSDSHLIIDAIHESIATCGFVIADLTDGRPNVYYEIGYAKGLGKRVILTAKKGTEVQFDLHGYNRIEWDGSANLKHQLKPVLKEISSLFGMPDCES